MAPKATQSLLNLFGWLGKKPPRDRPRPGDDTKELEQYGQNPYQVYSNTVKPPYERRRRYDIYDEMDELPMITTILDAYSEDGTQYDREQKASIWIEAKSSKVQKELDELKKRTDWENIVEPVTRDVGKYGDDFAINDIVDNEIVGLDWTDPRDIERIENRQGTLLGFEKTEKLREVVAKVQRKEVGNPEYTFKPWDIVHFRLYRRKRVYKQKFRNVYGTALLAGSERTAKQVKILDDMLMVRRLSKTLDTRVYKIDVKQAQPTQIIQILKRWKNALKRTAYIDPTNLRHDTPFDPYTWQEDIFWAAREGSNSGVDVIQGQPNVADIVDIEHFRDQLFGGLRAPKAYFGFEGDLNAKATLSAQDMKWGRAVNALQRGVKNGFTRMCQIQLALKNMPYDPDQFRVMMVIPSVLEDLSRLESMQTLIDVAERMASLGESLNLDPDTWRVHILKSVLGMTEDDIEKYSADIRNSDPPDISTKGPGDPDDDGSPGDDPDHDEPESRGSPSNLDEKTALRHSLLREFGRVQSNVSESAKKSELPTKEGPRSDHGDLNQPLPIQLPEESEDADSGDTSGDDSSGS